jgi:hypothetical protein
MGYLELDQAMGGGLDAGSMLSIEIDPEVSMAVPFLLIRRIITSFALSGNQVRLFPFQGLSQGKIEEYLRVFVPRSHAKNVTLLDSPGEGEVDEGNARGPVLSVLDSRGVTEKRMGHISSLTHSSKGAAIFVGKDSSEKSIFRNVSGVGGLRLRIKHLNGTLFLQSKVPLSQLFGLNVNQRLGVPEIDLDPIV